MINALARLIYTLSDSLDRRTFLGQRFIASPGTQQSKVPTLILLLMLVLSLNAQALARSLTTTTAPDTSEVRIVIKPADYSSFNLHRKSNESGPHRFVGLPEISRHTLNLYFANKAPTTLNANIVNSSIDATIPRHVDSNAKASSSTNNWLKDQQIEKKFLKPAGVFVTLSKHGKTRACWGSVYAREATIAKETEIATLGALSKDYRYKPISKTELADLKIQVTVIRAIEAVNNVKMIDPFKDGILVRSGGRGGVILPGEAVDAYYEFVLARLKAGIKPNEPCQIYKLRAEIYD